MDDAALRRQFSELGYVPAVMDRQAFGSSWNATRSNGAR